MALLRDVSAQTPAQRRAAAQVEHDPIYVALRGSPPTVNVEAQSQWPAIALGIAGLLFLWLQLRIMGRQSETMNRQTAILDRQTVLGEQQTAWRREQITISFSSLTWRTWKRELVAVADPRPTE